MNTTLTFTFTRTNTFTNAISNTYTHTNLPLMKWPVDKALKAYVVRRSICNIDDMISVDFNHIGYPPTLPGGSILSGRTPTHYKKDGHNRGTESQNGIE